MNILSHVRANGQQTMAEKPFDTLDSLALAQLVYIPMEGMLNRRGETTVRQLWIDASLTYLEPFPTFYMNKCYTFLQSCAAAPRYAQLKISNYINHVDPHQETQFCACTFTLPDGAHYIAFRGTDVSMTGWKEDFNMSFMTVPAQREAADYVERIAKACRGPLLLGGHSKGGNLALYAACHVSGPVLDRIRQVYSFDGPGVDKPTLDGEGYHTVHNRVQSWVPQSSVVGMLLCYHPDYLVVKSSAIGLMQHDSFTWHVENGAFVQLSELNLTTRVANEALNRWLDQRSTQERQFMVDVIFQIVSGMGEQSIGTMLEDFKGKSLKLFSAFNKLDLDKRAKATMLFTSLLSTEAGYGTRQLLTNVFRLQAEGRPEGNGESAPTETV